MTPMKEVTIGTQVWMSENLNVEKFRNGDTIPHAKTDEEWKKAGDNGEPAWCYYDNDPSNGEKYGKLYNWYAVNDPRGLAPKGWHLPSDEEWTTLTDLLGGLDAAGTKMKSKSGWEDEGNGTNESGFSGLPGGLRYSLGTFDGIGGYGRWWSSTEDYADYACFRSLGYSNGYAFRHIFNKEEGFSVRCLRDLTETSPRCKS
ncbi:fibrobacter succinogenes major paralogous domain-containing protein [Cyclobacterium sp. SYSU L10401]|uniref:fibrobacter succinogenes major paralogous domain-containing protein n=1 Tax=Cyclobacterium sp. SYSU L10401 TaxID=2678657 RepID=UPI0013D50DA7|nr:fibrobacter succinogenes major paralogous domain-containing protein [Cyclobacterium sp. SYSU L10401]